MYVGLCNIASSNLHEPTPHRAVGYPAMRFPPPTDGRHHVASPTRPWASEHPSASTVRRHHGAEAADGRDGAELPPQRPRRGASLGRS